MIVSTFCQDVVHCLVVSNYCIECHLLMTYVLSISERVIEKSLVLDVAMKVTTQLQNLNFKAFFPILLMSSLRKDMLKKTWAYSRFQVIILSGWSSDLYIYSCGTSWIWFLKTSSLAPLQGCQFGLFCFWIDFFGFDFSISLTRISLCYFHLAANNPKGLIWFVCFFWINF